MRKLVTIGLLVALAAGIGAAVLRLPQTPGEDVHESPSLPALQVRRLLPVGDDEVVPVPSPGMPVEFLYELSNVGTMPLLGLRTQLFCQCAVSQPLPETIAAGESAQFGFRFPPPQAGVRSEKVMVLSGSSSTPIAELNAQVYADVTVPHVVVAPDTVHIQVIRGQPINQDVLISVIERIGSENLIQRPQAEPAEIIHPVIIDVRESTEYDRKNVRRVYQLQLRLDAADVTRDAGGWLQLCEHRVGQLWQIPVKIEVLEPVVLIPKSFDFHPPDVASGRKQIVNVVRRGNVVAGVVSVQKFDPELVDVRRVSDEGSQVQRFEVTPKTSTTDRIETQVVFETAAADGAKDELVLLVRLIPE